MTDLIIFSRRMSRTARVAQAGGAYAIGVRVADALDEVLDPDLIDIVASKMEPLRYSQVGTDEVFAGKVNPALPLFPAQMVYQHLEAYLEALGLTAYGITTATFFDPTQFA